MHLLKIKQPGQKTIGALYGIFVSKNNNNQGQIQDFEKGGGGGHLKHQKC